VRSFDAPRPRPAPSSFAGTGRDGEPVERTFGARSLVIVVKSDCDGCRAMLESDLEELAGFDVVVVSAAPDLKGEWALARQRVVVAPRLLEELDVRSAPFYVLLDGPAGRVLSEGVVFGPSQVAAEVASFR
jgi:hypothetical protein